MGWEQIASMINENRAEAQRETNEPPVACPLDGAILNINPRGDRDCPMGNYRWAGGIAVTPTSV